MSVEVYIYIFLFLFLSLLIKGFFRGTLLHPTTIYCLIMLLYPIVLLFVVSQGLISLYWWFPDFTQAAYLLFSEISLAAILPLYIVSMVAKPINPDGKLVVTGIDLMGTDRLVFVTSIMIFIMYVLINFNQVLAVDYKQFKNESNQYIIVAALDYLIFFSLIFRLQNPSLKFSLLERSLLIVYFLIKIILGGRMFMVTIGMALVLIYFIKKRPDVKEIRKYSLFLPVIVLVMAAVVAIRERTFNFLSSGWSLSQEYLNSCISALNVCEQYISGKSEFHFLMLLDPVYSMIPSALLSRDSFVFFQVVNKDFGGLSQYAPIGGAYLPQQIFLIFPSTLFVFIYFSIFAFCLYKIENRLLVKKLVLIPNYMVSAYIGILSIFLVFSVRHFYYVHIKTLFLIIISIFMMSIISLLWCGLLKFGRSGNFVVKKKVSSSF